MEFLGVIEGITAEGRALIRCESAPELGCIVYDMDKRRIGIVKRVLGPVDSPYASVDGENISSALKGRKVYSNTSGKDGRSKGKYRKH